MLEINSNCGIGTGSSWAVYNKMLIFVIGYMDRMIFDKASSIFFSAIVSSSRVFLNNRPIVMHSIYEGYGSNVNGVLIFTLLNFFFETRVDNFGNMFKDIYWKIGKTVTQIRTRGGVEKVPKVRIIGGRMAEREQDIRNSRARGSSNRDFMRHRNFEHRVGTLPRIGQRLDCSLG